MTSGSPTKNVNWVVVSNIFYFHPYLGKIPMLTNIFQMGWNHQPVKILVVTGKWSSCPESLDRCFFVRDSPDAFETQRKREDRMRGDKNPPGLNILHPRSKPNPPPAPVSLPKARTNPTPFSPRYVIFRIWPFLILLGQWLNFKTFGLTYLVGKRNQTYLVGPLAKWVILLAEKEAPIFFHQKTLQSKVVSTHLGTHP